MQKGSLIGGSHEANLPYDRNTGHTPAFSNNLPILKETPPQKGRNRYLRIKIRHLHLRLNTTRPRKSTLIQTFGVPIGPEYVI